jgi:hypothetical protein
MTFSAERFSLTLSLSRWARGLSPDGLNWRMTVAIWRFLRELAAVTGAFVCNAALPLGDQRF